MTQTFTITLTITVQPAPVAAAAAPMATPSDRIIRQRVDSSVLVSVGYRASDETLELEYIGGRVYQYARVPQGIVDDLLEARSLGQFVNQKIKPFYTATLVTGGGR